jgi:uncharacterized protein
MGIKLSGLLAGLLFGIGLSISGMVNPAKVMGFLDFFGQWDPSLAFVMGGAVTVYAIGYRLVMKSAKPLFDETFQVPTRSDLDARLISGAVLFGAGWGLAGYCPGPAITGLAFGMTQTFIFFAAMAVGVVVFKLTMGAKS